jgi:hypothetical protein
MQSHLRARGQKILRKAVEFLNTMLHRTSTGSSQDIQPRTPVTGSLLYTETKHKMQVNSSWMSPLCNSY